MRTITGLWLLLTCLCGLLPAGCVDVDSSSVPVHDLDFARRPWAGTDRPPAAGTDRRPSPPKYTPPAVATPQGARPWRYIVIHHSAEPFGNASTMGLAHRARGWDELGYHFVITNGDGGPDGQIQVGPRWPKQKHGAHTGRTPGNEYNEYGIGICLVGDFSAHMPSRAQMASLRRLVDQLMAAYNIPANHVIGHREAPGATTECPGDVLFAYLTRSLRPELARTFAASVAR